MQDDGKGLAVEKEKTNDARDLLVACPGVKEKG